MKYYLAPMEGITGYIYRKTYHSLFPSFDKYMTPFLAPKQGKKLSGRDKREILPENNQGMEVIPQILTNQAEDFVRTARELAGYGYKEVNLNLGCPSGTVVSKKKGAGLLGEPEMLKRLLEGIFDALNAKAAAGTTIEISIKTRLGMEDAEEFGPLLEIYHDYPLKELIVHPRVREDYYANRPNWDAFAMAQRLSFCPVIYNGDLFCVEDVEAFQKRFPQTDGLMLGRGILSNPALLRQLLGGPALSASELEEFLGRLADEYGHVLSGERDVLFKMKELWFYLIRLFPDSSRQLKQIRKAQRLTEYEAAVASLLSDWEGVPKTGKGRLHDGGEEEEKGDGAV